MFTKEKEQLVAVCQKLHQGGLISGYDGNISMRVDDTHILLTKSKIYKGLLAKDDILTVTLEGKVVDGEGSPSKEFPMHQIIYVNKPDTRGVVHTHAPFSTAFTITDQTLPENILIEGKLILGPIVYVPYAQPGTNDLAYAIKPFLAKSRLLLLQNHGVVTYGKTLAEACSLMEMLENSCKTVTYAKMWGSLIPIPEHELDKL